MIDNKQSVCVGPRRQLDTISWTWWHLLATIPWLIVGKLSNLIGNESACITSNQSKLEWEGWQGWLPMVMGSGSGGTQWTAPLSNPLVFAVDWPFRFCTYLINWDFQLAKKWLTACWPAYKMPSLSPNLLTNGAINGVNFFVENPVKSGTIFWMFFSVRKVGMFSAHLLKNPLSTCEK